MFPLLFLMLRFERYKPAFNKCLNLHWVSACQRNSLSWVPLRHKQNQKILLMLLIHKSHVILFELPLETRFEVCYTRSYYNASSVLQGRKPGKKQQQTNKAKKQKQIKTIQSLGNPSLFFNQVFLFQENVLLAQKKK